MSFVAIDDVARLATLVLEQPEARHWTVEIGGSENLTLHQVFEAFERVLHQMRYASSALPQPAMPEAGSEAQEPHEQRLNMVQEF